MAFCQPASVSTWFFFIFRWLRAGNIGSWQTASQRTTFYFSCGCWQFTREFSLQFRLGHRLCLQAFSCFVVIYFVSWQIIYECSRRQIHVYHLHAITDHGRLTIAKAIGGETKRFIPSWLNYRIQGYSFPYHWKTKAAIAICLVQHKILNNLHVLALYGPGFYSYSTYVLTRLHLGIAVFIAALRNLRIVERRTLLRWYKRICSAIKSSPVSTRWHYCDQS